MCGEELVVKSWKEAKKIFEEFTDGRWIFRGQSDSEWPLATSLERWISANKKISRNVIDEESAERLMLEEFKRGAHHYLPSYLHLPKTTLEWLALMQYYGTPTRLLDFTRSPFVASFFAFEDVGEPGKHCAVWVVNEIWCRTTAISIINEAHKGESNYKKVQEYTDLSEEKYFEKIFLRDPKIPRMVFPVCSKRRNERLTMQQGLFLCPGGAAETFEEQLENLDDSYNNVKKITIPNESREEVIKDLNLMNINSSTLFPGLDGFARSLRNYIYV